MKLRIGALILCGTFLFAVWSDDATTGARVVMTGWVAALLLLCLPGSR